MIPDFVTEIPVNVQQAMWKILNSVPGSDVRQGIVDALTWGMNQSIVMGKFVNSLGLCVEDHKLCYTTKDVLPTYDSIPSEITRTLNDILTARYGRDTRGSIVKALEWGGDYTSQIAGFIDDLGLTVVDGKLCAIFGEAPLTREQQRIKDAYSNRGMDVPDEGYPYLGQT